MPAISRREFFGRTAIAVGAAASLDANPLGLPIGSQTYPHRQRIKDGDFAGLCKDMAAAGIRSIELCTPTYAEFASLLDGKQVKRVLDDHGLICPSAHCGMKALRTRQQEMIAWAKDIGMTQMATASLAGPMQNGVTTMDAVKKLADEYNKIAAEAHKAGLQQILHDERFEMSKIEADGRVVYQALLELLDPQLVKMQYQMTSMRFVGEPIGYFKKYPGRFISMHLQGVDLNAPLPEPAHETPQNIPVGKDSLDWPAIFRAAKKGGLKNYFVEQDWDATMQSVAYLKKLKV
jgi:sugar phosphate isomerase/epimerase